MTLREQAVRAMWEKSSRCGSDRHDAHHTEDALDALLGFLRDNADKLQTPRDVVTPSAVKVLTDLLGGEQ